MDGPKPGFKMAPSKWEEVDGTALEAQGIYKDFSGGLPQLLCVCVCLNDIILMFHLQL